MPDAGRLRDDATRKAVANERVKLSGNALNTLSVAVVVSGCILPLIGVFYGTVEPKSRF